MIHVTIERVKPLAGVVTSASREVLPFEGWLGLLGVLSELVDAADRSPDRAPDP